LSGGDPILGEWAGVFPQVYPAEAYLSPQALQALVLQKGPAVPVEPPRSISHWVSVPQSQLAYIKVEASVLLGSIEQLSQDCPEEPHSEIVA
jgi:hypothetical protein